MIKKSILCLMIGITSPAVYSGDHAENLTFFSGDMFQVSIPSFSEELRANIEEVNLSDLDNATIHFFWATGRTLSDNPDYQADTSVNIGGGDLGEKIFPSIDSFLGAANEKIRVYFVVDQPTYNANKEKFDSLTEKYTDRFKILDIHSVVDNICEKFPDHKEKIDVIFRNATAGSPVIASDVYRLIGMPYGRGSQSEAVIKEQHTYCDIDLFCEYINEDYLVIAEDFLHSLLAPQSTDNFYLGRHMRNNDLIKLLVKNSEDYEAFCNRILMKLNIEDAVFTEKQKTHQLIKSFELMTPEEINTIDLAAVMPYILPKLVKAVTKKTGPVFLDKLKSSEPSIRCDLKYNPIAIGAWHRDIHFLYYENSKFNSPYHPLNIFNWYGVKTSQEIKDSEKNFLDHCLKYRGVLSAAIYAKKFGPTHPFNVAARDFLIKNFPFSHTSFVDLKAAHFKAVTIGFQGTQKEKNIYWDSQVLGSKTHYHSLLSDIFKSLDIRVPVTEEEITTPPSLEFIA